MRQTDLACIATRMRRGFVLKIFLIALAAPAAAGAAEVSPPHEPLSGRDAAIYEKAFNIARNEATGDALSIARKAKSRILMGRLEYLTLINPARRPTVASLKRWLAAHRNDPGADRIAQRLHGLAPSDRTMSTPAPVKTPLGGRGASPAARAAFFLKGDPKAALLVADRSGDLWIGGLSAWRLGRTADARRRFEALAHDPTRGDSDRAAGAFWAARAASALGDADGATRLLKIAAEHAGFYGLMSRSLLGADAIANGGHAARPRPSPVDLDLAGGRRLLSSDLRAKRAAALVQIGATADAADEVRAVLASELADAARRRWNAVAKLLGLKSVSGVRDARPPPSLDPAAPLPTFTPLGGFTVDRALLYAVARKESSFNPKAVSPSGSAFGLMQITPATAAAAAAVPVTAVDASLLSDPEINLRLGQDHLARLLRWADGDLVRTLAAYNAGLRAIEPLTRSALAGDTLMLLESLPSAETRDFVETVLMSYWVYKRRFGEASPSLDALASGGRATLDPPSQTPALDPMS